MFEFSFLNSELDVPDGKSCPSFEVGQCAVLTLWLGILNLICGWLSSETWAFSVIYA